jgi:hypothetical protein
MNMDKFWLKVIGFGLFLIIAMQGINAQTEDVETVPVDAGFITPAHGLLWRLELMFEKIPDSVSNEARIMHMEERYAEMDKMLENDDSEGVEDAYAEAQKIREKVKITERTRERVMNLEKEAQQKFKITPERIDELTEKINDRWGGRDDIKDGDYLLEIKMFDGEIKYFDVKIEDAYISNVKEVSEQSTLDGYLAKVSLSQGEVYGLHKRNTAGMIALFNRLKYNRNANINVGEDTNNVEEDAGDSSTDKGKTKTNKKSLSIVDLI